MSDPSEPPLHNNSLMVKAVADRLMAYYLRLRDDEPYRNACIESSKDSTEQFEWILGKPNAVLERLALNVADALIASGGAHVDQEKVDEALLRDPVVLGWLDLAPVWTATEEQRARHGSEMLCHRGQTKFERGLFSQSQVFFQRAIDLDETNIRAWSGLADALQALGKTQEADDVRKRIQDLGYD